MIGADKTTVLWQPHIFSFFTYLFFFLYIYVYFLVVSLSIIYYISMYHFLIFIILFLSLLLNNHFISVQLSLSLFIFMLSVFLYQSLSLSLYLSTVHFHLLCSSLLCHIFSFLVEFNFHLSVGSAFVARRLSFKSSNYFSFFKKDVIIQARARAACVWRAQISVTRCCQTKMPNFTDIAQKCSQIFLPESCIIQNSQKGYHNFWATFVRKFVIAKKLKKPPNLVTLAALSISSSIITIISTKQKPFRSSFGKNR